MDAIGPGLPPAAAAEPRAARNRETARAFEAVFLGQMAQLMMESVESGEFPGGHGEAVFRGVLAEQLGTAMAAGGGLGLQPAVMEQIIKLQGGDDAG